MEEDLLLSEPLRAIVAPFPSDPPFSELARPRFFFLSMIIYGVVFLYQLEQLRVRSQLAPFIRLGDWKSSFFSFQERDKRVSPLTIWRIKGRIFR